MGVQTRVTLSQIHRIGKGRLPVVAILLALAIDIDFLVPCTTRSLNPIMPQDATAANAAVTPELLVDALSGHEDGLLAIAEKLMESYDAGYDVMGESIIDAFADVQKLFQHVVEAAHMEGAAFEASRREQELRETTQNTEGANTTAELEQDEVPLVMHNGGPTRHDEFIDPDVKEVLTEAIRNGAPLRDANKHMECYQEYEHACQNASSLLPVDSDHRGRLQLSIARAESMSPDRACAILRYAMDDVLRSGLRPSKGATLPDVSKRGDCVLVKPKEHPSLLAQAGVVQSSEEALASLVEEMKEVLSAPIYDNTPLQSVAERFWGALGEAQRSQMKNEERLEQSLGKLKGEFLLARAVCVIVILLYIYIYTYIHIHIYGYHACRKPLAPHNHISSTLGMGRKVIFFTRTSRSVEEKVPVTQGCFQGGILHGTSSLNHIQTVGNQRYLRCRRLAYGCQKRTRVCCIPWKWIGTSRKINCWLLHLCRTA